jgi:hypothetical protein
MYVSGINPNSSRNIGTKYSPHNLPCKKEVVPANPRIPARQDLGPPHPLRWGNPINLAACRALSSINLCHLKNMPTSWALEQGGHTQLLSVDFGPPAAKLIDTDWQVGGLLLLTYRAYFLIRKPIVVRSVPSRDPFFSSFPLGYVTPHLLFLLTCCLQGSNIYSVWVSSYIRLEQGY